MYLDLYDNLMLVEFDYGKVATNPNEVDVARIKREVKTTKAIWGFGNDRPFPSIYNGIAFDKSKRITMGMSLKQQKAIYQYVFKDKPAVGYIGDTLNKLALKAKGSTEGCVIYRGMKVDRAMVDSIIKTLEEGDLPVFSMVRPSSWTSDMGSAWDFAKEKGYRAGRGDTSLVFKIFAPRGTKAVNLHMSFGVGNEVMLPKNVPITIVEIETYQRGYRVIGTLGKL